MIDNTTISKKHYPARFLGKLKGSKVYEETVKINSGNTLFIAHRGLSKLEKENTVPAFKLAAEHSYYGIEADVRKSKDGNFFIIHDADTKRIARENIVIKESTSEQIRSIELTDMHGNASSRYIIPTLVEFILACKKKNKIAVLELKEPFTPEDIKYICESIKEEEYLQNTVFISFYLENLLALREKYPDQPVQYLSSSYHEGIVELLVNNKFDLDIFFREMTEERVKELHDNGIKINVWTVDFPKDAEKLIRWGVDYITTNILETKPLEEAVSVEEDVAVEEDTVEDIKE